MIRSLTCLTVALLCTACATPTTSTAPAGSAPAPAAAPAASTGAAPAASTANVRVVKSRDGSFDGEVAGTPVANSRIGRLQIGMSMTEVQEAMGRAPDRFHTYETGKRWIPFYFGNDARRLQALYKGEGCLIFTHGNVWGGAGGDLIRIDHDASGACYQP
ncbi:MAG: hypothetical protein MUC68_01680 [Burkholderiaceae bacterium]|nr:hypothetical protein [Burkholderiaceae bacterium]